MKVFCDSVGRRQAKTTVRNMIRKAGGLVKIINLPGTALRVIVAPEAGKIYDITREVAICIGVDRAPEGAFDEEDTVMNVPEGHEYMKEYWIEHWINTYLFPDDHRKVSVYVL